MSKPSELQQPTTQLTAGPGVLVVLSGPSGVGKDTILKALFERDPSLHYSVTNTTRSPRPGEVEGSSYVFVTEVEFWKLAKKGELLEWAHVSGYWYGSSVSRIRGYLDRQEDVILKIDVQGAASIRPRIHGNAVFIFIAPPSFEELSRRLIERNTEKDDQLTLRLETARLEMAEAPHYDTVVINDDVDKAVTAILTIIEEHRLRAPKMSTSQ